MVAFAPKCAALFTVLTAGAVGARADGECATTYNTLSTDCRGVYDDIGSLCVVFDRRANELTPCDYASTTPKFNCFGLDACDVTRYKAMTSETTVEFSIRFGGPTGQLTTNWRHSGPVRVTPNVPPYEVNEYIMNLGSIRLDDQFNTLRIFGGESKEGTQGLVAVVNLDDNFLLSSPQLQAVTLVNLDIGSQLSQGGIATRLPRGVNFLDLSNTKMSSLPPDLSLLSRLVTLVLTDNEITSVPSMLSLPHLTTLQAANNASTSFAADLPSIQYLDLTGNSLKTIPDAIFSMKNLRMLNISGNPIATMQLTSEQRRFLSNPLLSLDISLAPPSTSVGTSATAPDESTQNNSLTPSGSRASNTVSDSHGGTSVSSSSGNSVSGGKVPASDNSEDEAGVPTSSTSSSASPPSSESQNSSMSASPNGVFDSSSISSSLGRRRNTTTASTDPANSKDGDAADAVQQGKGQNPMVVTFIIVGFAVFFLVGGAFVYRGLRSRNSDNKEDDEYSVATTPQTDTIKVMRSVSARSNFEKPDQKIVSAHIDPIRRFGSEARDVLLSKRVRLVDIRDVRLISSSEYTVYRLVIHRGSRLLASKQLIEGRACRERLATFIGEIVIVAKLDHPSIVSLVGVGWIKQEVEFQALFEYMPNGTLESWLHGTSEAKIPWLTNKLSIAIKIAEALVYAHSFDPPLLHRDLRTRNVLLSEHFEPKLSGFGSARFMMEDSTMTTKGVGSGRWLAPEVLAGRADYGTAADIYAFGIVLLELDTHLHPYSGIRCSSIVETELLQRVESCDLRPILSSSCHVDIRSIFEDCVAYSSKNRPTALQIAYGLRMMMRQCQHEQTTNIEGIME